MVGLRGGGGASQRVGGADGTLPSSTFWVGIQCGSPPQPPQPVQDKQPSPCAQQNVFRLWRETGPDLLHHKGAGRTSH